jgi:Zn-dependent M28 family amino/carboxypeptidase
VLSESGAAELFDLAGRDLTALFERHLGGEAGGFELDVSATLARQSAQRRATAPNVLGLLRGGDRALRGEFVLYTAHLDHLGIRPGTAGDEIHNGAYDNAAGVAAVLEIARAMTRASPRPRRSIIFAAVTAEEKGLQGSQYLATHTPVPIEDIVANINIDMPYLGFPIADVEGFGVEHSTLHLALTRATGQLGLTLTPDPRPELVRFIRSDQFSFVERGVPSLILKPGSKSADAAIDGGARLEAFLRDHYHRPSDDLDLPFSEQAAERFVRAALLLGLDVANDDRRPEWNDNDFFGDRFARRPPSR